MRIDAFNSDSRARPLGTREYVFFKVHSGRFLNALKNSINCYNAIIQR